MQKKIAVARLEDRNELVPVLFEFTHPTAKSVSVGGSFNQWSPWLAPLTSEPGGRWVKFTALAPGTYEYCLVVDGEWMVDPLNQVSVGNPFGGRNSLMTVEASAEHTHLVDAENAPLGNAFENNNQRLRKRFDLVCEAMAELNGKGREKNMGASMAV